MVQKLRKHDGLLVVDPIMGDSGKAFPMYSQEFLNEIRELVRHADVITPNLTEAVLLLKGSEGLPEEWETFTREKDDALRSHIRAIAEALAEEYQIPTIVITGIEEATFGNRRPVYLGPGRGNGTGRGA